MGLHDTLGQVGRLALSLFALLGAAQSSVAAAAQGLPEPADGESAVAVLAGRVVAVDEAGSSFQPGLVAAIDGRIVYVGRPIEIPQGYRRVEQPSAWAVPGMVDLHSHVNSGGWGDLNDMVLPLGPELRSEPTIVPGNQLIRLCCASGVTTLFLIPGSGTSISGFGTLFKTRTEGPFERAVLASPGGMKVAQSHNPERRAGDLGATRAGLSWQLGRLNDRARAANARGEELFDLADLQRVHRRELPALIHCAGSDGTASTIRMWKERYDVIGVVSHGSLGGHWVADYAARVGMPVNHGPRTFDFVRSRTGSIEPSAYAYWASGLPNFSLNTDAPVIPGQELFLQGTMTARQGVPGLEALRALTLHPARSFGIGDRVGSLEVGKDADIVLYSGSPLDPRSRVEMVLIDGEVQYDRKVHGQWF